MCSRGELEGKIGRRIWSKHIMFMYEILKMYHFKNKLLVLGAPASWKDLPRVLGEIVSGQRN